ncbi:MAG: hypothetical protein RBJ76_12855 [Stenomitos frigidus ULC029]
MQIQLRRLLALDPYRNLRKISRRVRRLAQHPCRPTSAQLFLVAGK